MCFLASAKWFVYWCSNYWRLCTILHEPKYTQKILAIIKNCRNSQIPEGPNSHITEHVRQNAHIIEHIRQNAHITDTLSFEISQNDDTPNNYYRNLFVHFAVKWYRRRSLRKHHLIHLFWHVYGTLYHRVWFPYFVCNLQAKGNNCVIIYSQRKKNIIMFIQINIQMHTKCTDNMSLISQWNIFFIEKSMTCYLISYMLTG